LKGVWFKCVEEGRGRKKFFRGFKKPPTL